MNALLKLILIFILIYLISQIYIFFSTLNPTFRILSVGFKCYCKSKKELYYHKYPLIIPTYYYLNEVITLSSNGSKKLKYCEKRSKSLHYDFKETLDSLLLSNQKIFIAIMLHNNEATFPAWFSEFQRLINFLKPINPFVSILESQSRDLTPMW